MPRNNVGRAFADYRRSTHQKRRSDQARLTSGMPLIAARKRTSREVRFRSQAEDHHEHNESAFLPLGEATVGLHEQLAGFGALKDARTRAHQSMPAAIWERQASPILSTMRRSPFTDRRVVA